MWHALLCLATPPPNIAAITTPTSARPWDSEDIMHNQPHTAVPVSIEQLPPSLTLRIGKRRLTLARRSSQQMPQLLQCLLQRSWRAMFGASLRISLIAAAVCAAWNTSALAAAPASNTLPTGGTVTYGNATLSQNGNTLTINQGSNQAIANFSTFSIGANASVNINQPSAAGSFLARVTGNDPSQIYGLLQSNGGVALINQNGILVGPTGVVDVARFIASTLNISDSDFLAGRLNFTSQGISGDVENQGLIKTASGGSVYLVGANVTNSGVIQSPSGEILLAAGQTVQLVDTGTPGVTVNVTGVAGNVTNLGTIAAAAGSIGVAAGLINNSGTINASNVVADGGRIFLRASQALTTTASSSITADGAANGGSVVLYSAGSANIDGQVSARGASGQGGYVETSGLSSLNVKNVPIVGSGGTWYIDPYDLTVVSGSDSGVSSSAGVITSTGSGATISNSTIDTALNDGISVLLKTGAGGSSTGGNITVSAAIEKTIDSTATLTLDASQYININANITNTSGTLNLNLNSNYQGSNSGDHTVQVNGSGTTIALHGGTLTVSDGSSVVGSGNLSLNSGAVLDLTSSGKIQAGTLGVASGAFLLTDIGGNVALSGALNNSGNVTLQNSVFNATSLNNAATGNVTLSNTSGSLTTLNNDGALTLSNTYQSFSLTTLNNNSSGTATLSGITSGLALTNFNNSGALTLNNSVIGAGITNTAAGTITAGDGTEFSSLVTNAGVFNASGTDGGVTLDTGMINTGTLNVLGTLTANGAMLNATGGTVVLGQSSASTTLNGSGTWTNNGSLSVSGSSNVVSMSNNLVNNGSVLITGSSNTLATGDLSNSGNISIAASNVLRGGAFTNTGNVTLASSNMTFTSFDNQAAGTIAGNGNITVRSGETDGTLTNEGTLSPGGVGTVGSLTINGSVSQSSTGILNIDVAGDSSYDTLNINGSYTMGGTLQTSLLNGYVPTLGTSFTPVTISGSSSGYFRNVLGNVLTVSGTEEMIKAKYNVDGQGLQLIMAAPESITFLGGEGGWGISSSWSTGYIPTAVDNIIVSDSINLVHSSGSDTVQSITVGSDSSLSLTGGTLATTTLTSSGALNISAGSLTSQSTTLGVAGSLSLSGGTFATTSMDSSGGVNISGGALTISCAARMYSLAMSGGSLLGGSSSFLTVDDVFSQSAGTIDSSGTVVLHTNSGNLVVGNVTAANLGLAVNSGSISQLSGTSLHVTQQLLVSSTTGSTLNSSSNQIAAYAANNTTQGDIVLVNNLDTSDTSAVKIDGVTNANGSVNISNTGAAVTTTLGTGAAFLSGVQTDSGNIITLASVGITSSGAVSAAGTGSTVTLATHSPLTIGSGGVNAAGNIVLSAGNSGSSTDNLIVNGTVVSAGGNINLFAGNNMTVNANITTSAPGLALFTVANGVISYAAGVSITDANGTRIPVSTAVASLVTPAVTTAVASATSTIISSTKLTTILVTPTISTITGTTTTSETMTTGGEAGTFGGTDTSESSTSTGSNSSSNSSSSTGTSTGTSTSTKKAATKMYCS